MTISPLYSADPFPPSITRHPESTVVVEGQAASFTCGTNGEPTPVISWRQGNTLLSPSSQVTITVNNEEGSSVLTIANVRESNMGTYQCTASNSQGTVTSNMAQLQIASKCFLVCFSPDIHSMNLTCRHWHYVCARA